VQDVGTGLIVAIVILALLELALLAWALVDLIRRPQTSLLPKWAWVIVMLCFNFLGPVFYLLIGRQERTMTDDWHAQTGAQQQHAASPGAGGGASASGATAGAASDAAAGTAADGAATGDAAAGEDAVPAAPEAPKAPDLPEPGRTRSEQAIDALYGRNEPRQ